MKYYPPGDSPYKKFRDILTIFNDTPNLRVRYEDTSIESIIHQPTGWYFYTTYDNGISMFFRDTGSGGYTQVVCPWYYYPYMGFISKPNKTIQKAVYEAKIAK